MTESVVARIKDRVISRTRVAPLVPATRVSVEQTEAKLGFSVPNLLKSLYLSVGNGGFGPGGGEIVGLEGGHPSDLGTLAETYAQVREGAHFLGLEWRDGLLPFCAWGCNIFSCVDCKGAVHRLYLSQDCRVRELPYTLEDYFRMWADGLEIPLDAATQTDTVESINPFTGRPFRVSKRRS